MMQYGAIIAVLAFTATCSAQISRFQGTWENVDRSASGLTRVVIEGKKIYLVGNCDSKPCDRGEAKAITIFSLTDKTIVALHATQSTSFANTFIEIYPEGAENLRVLTRLNPLLPGQQRAMVTTGIFRRTASKP